MRLTALAAVSLLAVAAAGCTNETLDSFDKVDVDLRTVSSKTGYQLSSSVVSILAQRLVRKICPHCKEPSAPRLRPEGYEVPTWRGKGCDRCFGSGYTGRVGIFELMELNEEIRKLITRNEDATVLTEAARRNGRKGGRPRAKAVR